MNDDKKKSDWFNDLHIEKFWWLYLLLGFMFYLQVFDHKGLYAVESVLSSIGIFFFIVVHLLLAIGLINMAINKYKNKHD